MRTPNKSRSRNKNNRRNNNSGGNVLNRVYDSAGPEGKVRGTPQQVIDKYQGLAHDSALSGDRVAMENFQQHAEHYIRMINEAQRQIAERRENEAQANGNQNNNANTSNGRGGQDNQAADPGGGDQPEIQQPPSEALATAEPTREASTSPENGGLVETPETKAEANRKPRTRRPRPPKADKAADAPSDAGEAAGEQA